MARLYWSQGISHQSLGWYHQTLVTGHQSLVTKMDSWQEYNDIRQIQSIEQRAESIGFLFFPRPLLYYALSSSLFVSLSSISCYILEPHMTRPESKIDCCSGPVPLFPDNHFGLSLLHR